MWRLKLKLNVVLPEVEEDSENGVKGMTSLELPRHDSLWIKARMVE